MTFLLPDASVVDAYRDLRSRVIALWRTTISTDGETTGERPVPHCPAWSVRGETLAELADAWDATTAAFDAVLPHIPSPVNSQLVMDAVTHEHDLRHAVGVPGARDSLAVRVAVGWLLDMAEGRSPGLGAALHASGLADFDLLRVLSGRRSPAQMTSLGLDADLLEGMLAGSPLKPPALSLDE